MFAHVVGNIQFAVVEIQPANSCQDVHRRAHAIAVMYAALWSCQLVWARGLWTVKLFW